MTGIGWLICIVLSYAAGGIPFGVLIARTRGVNIREHGSKNIGATNVGRVLGKRLGVLCFIFDVLKGAIPVLAVGWFTELFGVPLDDFTSVDMLLWITIALAALLGHMYSPWLKFGGGKGVATTFGGMAAMWPLLTVPVLLAFFAWVITVRLWKIISLASLVAAIMLPIFTLCWIMLMSEQNNVVTQWPMLVITFAIAVLVVWKHRSNVQRIIHNQEPRIGATKQESL